MNRSRFYGIVSGLLFLLVAVVFFSSSNAGPSGSSLSKSPSGLLAARLYLEARGAEVKVLDVPLVAEEKAEEKPVTLVIAGPLQRTFGEQAEQALGEHLRRGGNVIYGYSAQSGEGPEGRLSRALGLTDETELRAEAPLAPLAWRDFRNEVWRLQPEASSPLETELEVAAFAGAPSAPPEAMVFYRAGQGYAPVIFEYEHQRGRILVLPAALLSNAEIHRSGNAGLLELILARGGAIAFDEHHHGLARLEEASHSARLGWNVFLLQLMLLYLAGLWALARGFGPSWAERLPQLGSAAAFFEQLGSLHHRLGHHRAAARALVERARALDPQVPAELLERAADLEKPFSSKNFFDLANEVSRHQPRRTKK